MGDEDRVLDDDAYYIVPADDEEGEEHTEAAMVADIDLDEEDIQTLREDGTIGVLLTEQVDLVNLRYTPTFEE